jgi:hypothetical protein
MKCVLFFFSNLVPNLSFNKYLTNYSRDAQKLPLSVNVKRMFKLFNVNHSLDCLAVRPEIYNE